MSDMDDRYGKLQFGLCDDPSLVMGIGMSWEMQFKVDLHGMTMGSHRGVRLHK
jgi:hypothetical protein